MRAASIDLPSANDKPGMNDFGLQTVDVSGVTAILAAKAAVAILERFDGQSSNEVPGRVIFDI